jgi:hypothetical protein
LKNSVSASVSFSPSTAFTTVSQLCQLGGEKIGPNSLGWRAITVTLEQTVDEVKATWTARTRARGKFAGQKSVRARGKSPYFLMSNMHPPHPASADRVGNIV